MENETRKKPFYSDMHISWERFMIASEKAAKAMIDFAEVANKTRANNNRLSRIRGN